MCAVYGKIIKSKVHLLDDCVDNRQFSASFDTMNINICRWNTKKKNVIKISCLGKFFFVSTSDKRHNLSRFIWGKSFCFFLFGYGHSVYITRTGRKSTITFECQQQPPYNLENWNNHDIQSSRILEAFYWFQDVS